MLDRAFVSEQQWSGGLEGVRAAVSISTLVGLPTYGPLTARNGFKRLSGYVDLQLRFSWVAFVTQHKKTPEARLPFCLYRLVATTISL